MKEFLARLAEGQTLSEEQAQGALEQIMAGQADPAQIGAFLALLAAREPTVEELVGAARVMRKMAVKVHAPDMVIDTCGAGGTGSRLFNVSTTAAIVAAACNVPVAKHGNKAVTSRSGSSDVLSELGVVVDASPEAQAACLAGAGLCFCFAPRHHPAMANVVHVRQTLGFATIFNLMGPLTNPAGARRQLAGVPRPALVDKMLHVLVRLGSLRTIVVCGTDPQEGFLCELSIGGPSRVGMFDGRESRSFDLEPRDVGLKTTSMQSCRVNSAKESAVLVKEVRAGKKGAPRDLVLLNSGAALWVGQRAESLREGIRLAAQAIDSGRAAHTLDLLVTISHGKST